MGFVNETHLEMAMRFILLAALLSVASALPSFEQDVVGQRRDAGVCGCLTTSCTLNGVVNGAAGTCTGEIKDGATCQHTCNTGYTVAGNVGCNKGVLTGGSCTANPCASTLFQLPTGASNKCTGSIASGATCGLTCATGFQPVPGKCLAGQAIQQPSCRTQICNRPTAIANSDQTDGGYNNCEAESAIGATCSPKCKSGYTLTGSYTCTAAAGGTGPGTMAGTVSCTPSKCTVAATSWAGGNFATAGTCTAGNVAGDGTWACLPTCKGGAPGQAPAGGNAGYRYVATAGTCIKGVFTAPTCLQKNVLVLLLFLLVVLLQNAQTRQSKPVLFLMQTLVLELAVPSRAQWVPPVHMHPKLATSWQEQPSSVVLPLSPLFASGTALGKTARVVAYSSATL